MPTVFTDDANAYDLTITTSADWTVSSGGMPNGDNYVTGDGSIANTYNLNGDDFPMGNGTAWTVECWLYYTTARAFNEMIVNVSNLTGGGQTFWDVFLDTDEKIHYLIFNTSFGAYLECVSPSALATATWHHVVCIKETGATLRIYLNGVEVQSVSSPTGTASTPDSAAMICAGVLPGGGLPINSPSSGLRIAHLAVYNSRLSDARILAHYNAMIGS